MSDSLDQLRTVLKQHGFSMTRARQVVFKTLQGSEPLTMKELTARAAPLDRASVYRVIALFEQLNIVQRLQSGWKYKLELTDCFLQHHHHLTCLHCGVVTTLPEDWILEHRLKDLTAAQGFSAQEHQLEIRGLCANCQPAA